MAESMEIESSSVELNFDNCVDDSRRLEKGDKLAVNEMPVLMEKIFVKEENVDAFVDECQLNISSDHNCLFVNEKDFVCEMNELVKCKQTFGESNTHSLTNEKCSRNVETMVREKTLDKNKKRLACDKCEKTFSQRRYLISHQRFHEGQAPLRPFACDKCDKCFTRKYYLRNHERFHTGKELFMCDDCDKGFSSKSSLIRHKMLQTGEKPFVCSVCGKGFSLRSHLVRHKTVHTGEKPYVCNVCKKRFSGSSHLIRHLRLHTGEKHFTCDVCQKSFVENSNLISHKRLHTGEKPYECEVCKQRFTFKSTYMWHMTHKGNGLLCI